MGRELVFVSVLSHDYLNYSEKKHRIPAIELHIGMENHESSIEHYHPLQSIISCMFIIISTADVRYDRIKFEWENLISARS